MTGIGCYLFEHHQQSIEVHLLGTRFASIAAAAALSLGAALDRFGE
jgi:hypothetical protein